MHHSNTETGSPEGADGNSLAKTPVLAVVGRREAETGHVALRRLGSDRQQVLALADAAAILAQEALAPDLARAARPPVADPTPPSPPPTSAHPVEAAVAA